MLSCAQLWRHLRHICTLQYGMLRLLERQRTSTTGHTFIANVLWLPEKDIHYSSCVSSDGKCSPRLDILVELGHNAKLTTSVYSSLLQRCGHAYSLVSGRVVHDHIIKHGSDNNTYLSNCLGFMYGHLGSVEEASALFSRLCAPDVFSWNFMIRSYAHQGDVQQALKMFQQMIDSNVEPDKFSFISILSASENHTEGALLHAYLVEKMFDKNILVSNSLVNFYGSSGRLDDAQRIFDMLPRRDQVTWNAIISTYALFGEWHTALRLFQEMLEQKVKPDKITFISLLSACDNMSALDEGFYLHVHIMDSDFSTDVSVENALINMYGKCGSLLDACIIFFKMDKKDIISWNSIISANAHNGNGMGALKLYELLQLLGWETNNVTLISTLDACACNGNLAEGKVIHTHVLHSNLTSDIVLGTAVVHMYGKCNSLKDAHNAFHRLPEHNLFSWNTIIAASSRCGQADETLCMLHRMKLEGFLPNDSTLVSVISACACQPTISEGKYVHAQVNCNKMWLDVAIATSLIYMYGKLAHLNIAKLIFDHLTEKLLVPWNAVIAVHSQHGYFTEVSKFWNQMQQEGFFPDKVTLLSRVSSYAGLEMLHLGKQVHTCIVNTEHESDISIENSLVNMYGKCKSPTDALITFENIVEKNVFSWNSLIGAYIHSDYGMLALEIFYRMLYEGVIPDEVTFISIIDASTMETTESECSRLYAYFIGSQLKLNAALASSFINMFGKCGRHKDALTMFERSPRNKVETWNSMMSIYAQNGQGREVLHLFMNMQKGGVSPNEVTFLSILCGCSHAGLIDEAWSCFLIMMHRHHITPRVEHYNCMLDVLGRAGKLENAEYLINSLPCQPTVAPLLSLLTACRYEGDIERGEYFATLALRVDPYNYAPYLMLRNIIATCQA